MKPLRKHLKLIALFVAVIFLMQSCSAYKAVDYETAVKSGKYVLVTLKDNESYQFLKIYEKDNQLIGIANINSKTTKNFNNKPITANSKYYYYILNKDEILKLEQIPPPSASATALDILIQFIIIIPIS